MDFPKTNKIHRDFESKVGENAALLQALVESVQWRRLFRYYAIGFGVFLASLFLLIVTVRFAMWLF